MLRTEVDGNDEMWMFVDRVNNHNHTVGSKFFMVSFEREKLFNHLKIEKYIKSRLF